MRPSCLTLVVALSTLMLARSADAQPCATGPGAAEPTAEARAANDLAVELANRDQSVEALALFRKAYELSPSHVILFNVGRMAEKTGDAAGAMHAYRCHVEEGGADVAPERKAEVFAALARLRQRVGILSVRVDEPGVVVSVDGTVVGQSPVSEIIRNPGSVVVAVERDPPQQQTVVLEAGKTSTLTFDRAPEVVMPSSTRFRFPEAAVGTAWVVTGLVIVSASVTGALSLVGAGEVESEVYLGPARRPPTGSSLADKADSTESLAIATDVLIAVGAVSGVAAITFSVVNAVADAEPMRQAQVVVSPFGLGLQIRGQLW